MGKVIITTKNYNLSTIQSISIPNPETLDDVKILLWIVELYKLGNICTLSANISVTDSTPIKSNKYYNIFTIPEGYRPIGKIYRNYVTQYGSIIIFDIDPNGYSRIFQISEPDSNLSDWTFIMRQDFTYITNE